MASLSELAPAFGQMLSEIAFRDVPQQFTTGGGFGGGMPARPPGGFSPLDLIPQPPPLSQVLPFMIGNPSLRQVLPRPQRSPMVPQVIPPEGVLTPEVPTPEPGMPVPRGLGADATGGRWHGSPSQITGLDEGYYSPMNIYGQGFYTTDAEGIAEGYAARGSNGLVYRVEEIEPVQMFDLEEPLPGWLTEYYEGPGEISKAFPQGWHSELDDLVADAAEEARANGMNVRQFYDLVRDYGTTAGYSADTIQEIFESLRQTIEERGYGGISHLGGLRTGNEAHTVKIYFSPATQLRISPNNPDILAMSRAERGQYIRSNYASLSPEQRVQLARSLTT